MDGWMDGWTKKGEDHQCKFTDKVKMPDPVRSDGWMDGQQKVKIAICKFTHNVKISKK